MKKNNTETPRPFRIFLSTRKKGSRGNYTFCTWEGNITQPDDKILAECRHLLTTDPAVSYPNQSDIEILHKIGRARAVYQKF